MFPRGIFHRGTFRREDSSTEKKPNLTETIIFLYGEVSHGEMSHGKKSVHGIPFVKVEQAQCHNKALRYIRT